MCGADQFPFPFTKALLYLQESLPGPLRRAHNLTSRMNNRSRKPAWPRLALAGLIILAAGMTLWIYWPGRVSPEEQRVRDYLQSCGGQALLDISVPRTFDPELVPCLFAATTNRNTPARLRLLDWEDKLGSVLPHTIVRSLRHWTDHEQDRFPALLALCRIRSQWLIDDQIKPHLHNPDERIRDSAIFYFAVAHGGGSDESIRMLNAELARETNAAVQRDFNNLIRDLKRAASNYSVVVPAPP